MPPIEYFGVMIPILGIFLGFFGVWTHHKQRLAKLQMTAGQSRAGNGEQTREIKELRERVGVLERIVTDGGYDVATQIEALRDQRRIDQSIESEVEAERLS